MANNNIISKQKFIHFIVRIIIIVVVVSYIYEFAIDFPSDSNASRWPLAHSTHECKTHTLDAAAHNGFV